MATDPGESSRHWHCLDSNVQWETWPRVLRACCVAARHRSIQQNQLRFPAPVRLRLANTSMRKMDRRNAIRQVDTAHAGIV